MLRQLPHSVATTPPSTPLELNCETLAGQLRAACLLECAARKPGNVHPWARFVDCSFEDFVRSADLIAPHLGEQANSSVGDAIFAAVRATREALQTNTNLGLILLLAPLAAVPQGMACESGIAAVLSSLRMPDSRRIFEAIRLAAPGGLGRAEAEDVSQEPTVEITAAMALAADRDLVARQYVNRFEDVLGFGRSTFLLRLDAGWDWETSVIGTHLELMARTPDSLIQRKCGSALARESQDRARRVINRGWPTAPDSATQLAELDHWLRADSHRRNPGTTADLIAAILFAVIRDGDWAPPATIEVRPDASAGSGPLSAGASAES